MKELRRKSKIREIQMEKGKLFRRHEEREKASQKREEMESKKKKKNFKSRGTDSEERGKEERNG